MFSCYILGPDVSASDDDPFSPFSLQGDGISSGTPLRSDFVDGLSCVCPPSPGFEGWAPFTHAPPSDFPKLKSFPGLKDLLGDWDLSILSCAGGTTGALVEAAAASFLFSGDLRNLKLRKPGSLGSLPVGDCGERAVPEENLLCSGIICFSFMTLLLPRSELGRLGLSPPDAPPPPPGLDFPLWLLSWWWSPPEESERPSSRSRRAWYSAWRWRSSSSRFLLCCCWKCCCAWRSCFWKHRNTRNESPFIHKLLCN